MSHRVSFSTASWTKSRPGLGNTVYIITGHTGQNTIVTGQHIRGGCGARETKRLCLRGWQLGWRTPVYHWKLGTVQLKVLKIKVKVLEETDLLRK